MNAPQRARRSTACPATTTKTQQRRKPPKANKRGRFETLVLRYYSGVYSVASRLTDDPVEAVGLTHGAFISTRKQLQTCCDENVLASILISNVIRAGLPLESNLTQTAQLQRRNNNFGRRYGAHGRTVAGVYFNQLYDSMTPMKQSRPNKLEPFIFRNFGPGKSEVPR